MEFKDFNNLIRKNLKVITKGTDTLYFTAVDKDLLWNAYLDSFPAGTNDLYRERREYDCGCCRTFIKNFGAVVSVTDGVVKSIWDVKTEDSTFQPVADALSALVKSKTIENVFVTKDKEFGTLKSYETIEDGKVVTWDHFYSDIADKFVFSGRKDTIGTALGQHRDTRNVFERSLTEISEDSVTTILDLISQDSLYKGNEWKSVLSKFLKLHKEYSKLSGKGRDIFCWTKSVEAGPVMGRIKNHSIGTLLMDISSGTELDDAVRKYEAMVAPSNYKRPKAIFTKKMIENAEKLLKEEGLIESLPRRFARMGDITINNILYANRDAVQKMEGSVFDDLKKEAKSSPKKLDKIESVSVKKFVSEILPTVTSVEALLENKHSGNLVSLIAPKNKDSKPLFKWSNGFSWAYNGNIADSMKERVKSVGGKVDGVLRFSIQWNTEGDNNNDFDAHCIEPGGFKIHYATKKNNITLGNLDVDIQTPKKDVAVENITWPNLSKMEDGTYTFLVNNYSHRGGTSGFQAEIEFNGKTLKFNYENELRGGENVEVAKVKLENGKFSIVSSLPSSEQSKTVWGLKTNEFHPVSICMMSPNYWDEQTGVGNKHYFLMLDSCTNEGTPNGFYNEFLKEEAMKHKKVFEALGAKMKVEESDAQLSGLGFSDTQRNSITLRVKGSFTRTLKVDF